MPEAAMSRHMPAALLALAASLCAGLCAAAPPPSTAIQTIDTMNKLWGRHPFMRANHAKGVVVLGSFTPTRAASSLSRADIFDGPAVPVTVRFSDSTGLPNIADGAPAANPHGMSIKFYQPGGRQVDVITNSLGFFPVATGEDFLAFLNANAASPPGTAKPTPVEQFIATHPAVPKAFATVATPVSFAREIYNGIDAFIFVNAAGQRQAFRFKIVPSDGVQHLPPPKAAKLPADVLVDELPKHLAHGTVTFHLMAQLAKPGDPTADPTKPWPATNPLVDLGTITLTKPAPDNALAQRQLHYLPTNLTRGIEASDDPLIQARVRAYVISFGRRAG
jgi:catalase